MNLNAILADIKTETIQNDRNASIDAQLNFTRANSDSNGAMRERLKNIERLTGASTPTPERHNDEIFVDTTHENIP